MTLNIFEAIYESRLEEVSKILENDPSVANSVAHELTPLILSCQLGKPKILQALLEVGGDPNGATDDGETPLHVSAFEACEPCTQMLLDAGATVNSTTDEGKTPLMNAAQAGSVTIIRMLLSAGADPTATDQAGRTSLHWATIGSQDDESVIYALLESGADASVTNSNGDSAFDYAQAMNKPSCLRALRNWVRKTARGK